jgi:hypothetical protein
MFISSKVTHIVTDGAANMKVAISKFELVTHLPCAAHKLNLCGLDIFKEKKSTAEERDKLALKQINIYNGNVKSLEKIITKCRSIVGTFRHSAKLTDGLKRTQLEMGFKPLKLVQDVKTRWNTTVDLLASVVTNHAPIASLAVDPSNLNLKKNLPDELEVSIIYDLIHLLEPLKDLTNSLSGHNYCTITSILPLVHFLIYQEVGNMSMGDARTEQARESLNDSLLERFSYLMDEHLDMFLGVTLLDTRYKCFDFLQDHDLKFKYQKRAIQYLVDFYEANFASSSSDSTPNSSIKNSTASSSPQASSFNAQQSTQVTTPKPASNKPKLLNKILDQQAKFGSCGSNPSMNYEFDIELEIDCYLRDIYVDESPLNYFKAYQRKYPILSKLATRLLHVTATSVPAECLFSQAGLIDTELRNRLSYSHLEKLIFLKENNF